MMETTSPAVELPLFQCTWQVAQEAVEEAAELGKVLSTAAEKTGEALAEEVPWRVWAWHSVPKQGIEAIETSPTSATG